MKLIKYRLHELIDPAQHFRSSIYTLTRVNFRFSLGLGVLLASYTWGANARRLQAMTDEDIIDECLESVAKIHQMSLKDVRGLFVRGVVKHWGLDQFSMGAFVFSYPYHVSEQFKVVDSIQKGSQSKTDMGRKSFFFFL